MTLTAAIQYVDSDTGRNYTVRLIPENTLTDDPSNRYPVGPISWRDGRLPFTFSDVEGEPHEEARHVGNLFNLRREEIDGTTWVVADLDWDTDELALEAKRLVDEDRITGVSIHGTDLDAYLICGVPEVPSAESVKALAGAFDPQACPETEWVEAWVDLVIGSATLLMLPAFEEAEVIVAAEQLQASTTEMTVTQPAINFVTLSNNTFDSDGPAGIEVPEVWGIVASDLKRPPVDWFADPLLTEPTPLTIDDNGRVMGHLALWSTCHRGFDSQCVTPPPDSTDYEEFHANAHITLDDGGQLGVGCLTFDVSHADTRISAAAAKRHYDHSGTVGAFVRAGQDDVGVWVAGAIRPGLTEDQIELMRRLSLSGDWRPKDGQYFLIAAQAVPVPGFPIRAKVASGVVEELTTRGPSNEFNPLEDVSEEALVASAVQHLVNEVRELRAELLEEKRMRDYEKAMEAFEEAEVGAASEPVVKRTGILIPEGTQSFSVAGNTYLLE